MRKHQSTYHNLRVGDIVYTMKPKDYFLVLKVEISNFDRYTKEDGYYALILTSDSRITETFIPRNIGESDWIRVIHYD